MKNLMNIVVLFLILTSTSCVPKQDAIEVNPYVIGETKPWIIAHGGAKALFPPNTMMAFQGAVNLGVDALEMDITMTKDEVLVTHHDLTIDRLSDSAGLMRDFTYEELSAFNFGVNFQDLDGNFPYKDSPVQLTKLEDVFIAFGNMPLMVEIKDRGEDGKRAAEILKNFINQYQLKDNIVVVAFSEEVLRYFYDITEGEILIGTSEEETKDFIFTGLSAMEFLYNPNASVIAIPTSNSGINLASKRVINSAHRRNMAVHYWTINEKEEMKRLINLGVDGLITDRPDLMKDVLDELGF